MQETLSDFLAINIFPIRKSVMVFTVLVVEVVMLLRQVSVRGRHGEEEEKEGESAAQRQSSSSDKGCNTHDHRHGGILILSC